MRSFATILALVLLLSGLLGPCPVCEQADATQPQDSAHACCAKESADGKGTAVAEKSAAAPNAGIPADDATNGERCERAVLSRALRSVESEQAAGSVSTEQIASAMPLTAALANATPAQIAAPCTNDFALGPPSCALPECGSPQLMPLRL